jgi:hypothetical protein
MNIYEKSARDIMERGDKILAERERRLSISGAETIKAAEKPSDTVSGVEVYHRSGWQRFAAIAAALLLTAGLTGTGAYYLKNHRVNVNDNNVIDSEIIAPVTNNGDMITTDTKNNEIAATETTVTKSKNDENTTTESVSSNKEKQATKTNTVTENKKDNVTTTMQANDEYTSKSSDSTAKSTLKTTAKQSSGKTTTQTTTTSPKVTTVRPKVEVPDDGKMTRQKLLEFVKNYGEDMTWTDFEPYKHEDIGSGQDVWRIDVYDGNEQTHTLLVCGLTEKKPSGVFLFKGTDTVNQERIDIRYNDVYEFLYPEVAFSNVLGTLKDCHPDFIRSIEISNPNSTYNAFLGYSEIKEMLSLIQNVKIENKGGAWETSSNMYYNILITDNQSIDHSIRVQYPYLVIDGTAYKAEVSGLNALFDYAASMVESHQPSEHIDVNGLWCWYDSTAYDGNPRDKTDSIFINQFPDLVFSFHGKTHSVAVYNSNGDMIGDAAAQFNVYFKDLNGDGYPELCSTYDWGLNSMIVIEVGVWDIHNNKRYSIASPDEYNYYLYEENGELFVNKEWAYSDWSITSKHGEKGRLRINGDNLEFVTVS